MARPYMRHRRAYPPSMLPMWLVASALVLPVAVFIPVPWVVAPWSIFVGFVVSSVRVWIWRRRHPRITPEEALEDLRRSAPWN